MDADKMVTVLIVEDFPLTATGLQKLVQDMDECRLIGVAATPEEAIRLARAEQPGVVTLDLRLGGSAAVGIQLARDLRDVSPDSRILICSAFVQERDVSHLLGIGIEGYVTKGEPPSVIATAIRALAVGQVFYSQPVSRIVQRVMRGRTRDHANALPVLSFEHIEILRLIGAGLANEDIAKRLSVSRTTVTRRIASIFQILQVTSRAGAVAKAAQLGYLDSC